MEHYAPHKRSAFEGYYSKFDLPSGAHIALIICSVPAADKNPQHLLNFTYYTKSGHAIFHHEHFVSEIYQLVTDSKPHAFELRVPGIGFMRCDADSTTTYELECPEWTFKATTTDRTPWDQSTQTPEGWLVHLPLPLHWHVHSFASPCTFKLGIPSWDLPPEDCEGTVTVHQEKNWANSFPSAHIWIQAHSPSTNSSICLAGGKILGMTAYLLGYRSPSHSVSFTPPSALAFFGLSPCMSIDIDWENRAFSLVVNGVWKKIEVRASSPKDRGWFGLASPFPEGFRKNFLTESFIAKVEVVVSERRWPLLGAWREVKREAFENASLEFGGEYFPQRGQDDWEGKSV
jgi:hypothetical protein